MYKDRNFLFMPFLSTVDYIRLEYPVGRNQFAGERGRHRVIFHARIFSQSPHTQR